MNRTVTALYDTLAKAEEASDALKAVHLGDHLDLHDQSEAAAKDKGGLGAWFGKLFGEGLRRGHVLLAARVDDFNEIRAATTLDTGPGHADGGPSRRLIHRHRPECESLRNGGLALELQEKAA